MRILVLTNFYPPLRSWGYTQLCYEVVEHLTSRSHEIAVLTSNFEAKRIRQPEDWVYRRLHLESDPNFYEPLSFFTRRRRQHKQDLATLRRMVEQFDPEMVFIWGMWNMSKKLPALAESLAGIKVVYYLSDHWPTFDSPHETYWRLNARHRSLRPLKSGLNWLARTWLAFEGDQPQLKFEYVMCVSRALRDSLVQSGIPVQHAKIVYNGIDTEAFAPSKPLAQKRASDRKTLKLLYAGRLSHDKGVHTAIEAMVELVHNKRLENLHLTVLGDGRPDYQSHLRKLVNRNDLNAFVQFREKVSRGQMPEVLRQFDILVFPSICTEALPRMPQEAMASGMVVVGTTTGGSRELLVEGENALTFNPGDASGLADQLGRLATDPGLRIRLVEAGHRTIMERFTIERMVDDIESYLCEVREGPHQFIDVERQAT